MKHAREIRRRVRLLRYTMMHPSRILGLCAALAVTATVAFATQDSRDIPTGAEGFGLLVPPNLITDAATPAAVPLCSAPPSPPAVLCSANYTALRVDRAIVLAAFGAHERPIGGVVLCAREEANDTPHLELRHQSAGTGLSAGAFLLAFTLPSAYRVVGDSLLVDDATGMHRVSIEEPPAHAEPRHNTLH